MSGIVRIGLRLVKTVCYITKQNTTKYLLSMCHVRNGCNLITKNSIISAQKESAGCLKTIKNYSAPLSIIAMNIVIYCAYKIKTNDKFWEEYNMWMAAWAETLKYSIIPSKMITSSVLFDDSKIDIYTEDDYISLMNDNSRNLILGKELDANIQEPFPRGEPIPVKLDRFNGLLDNGKLTLTTEDGDATFTFYHTLGFEVKKTSTTLQDEIAAGKKEPSKIQQKKMDIFNIFVPDHKLILKTSRGEYKEPITTVDRSDPVEDVSSNLISNYNDAFPIIGNFNFSLEQTVKVQADESDEVFHLKHHLKIECDRKLDENLQNIIATKEVSAEELMHGGTYIVFDCGTVVFKTQDGRKIIVKKKFDLVLLEDDKKIVYIDVVPKLKSAYV